MLRTCRQACTAIQCIGVVLQPLAGAPLQRPLRQPKRRAVKRNHSVTDGKEQGGHQLAKEA